MRRATGIFVAFLTDWSEVPVGFAQVAAVVVSATAVARLQPVGRGRVNFHRDFAL